MILSAEISFLHFSPSPVSSEGAPASPLSSGLIPDERGLVTACAQLRRFNDTFMPVNIEENSRGLLTARTGNRPVIRFFGCSSDAPPERSV